MWLTSTSNWFYIKEITLNNVCGPPSSSWKALRKKKNWVFLEKKFCLKTVASTRTWASSLQACPTDFRFSSPHNCVSQFLYIYIHICQSLCWSLSLSICVSISISYWSCFSGKSWRFSSWFWSWLFCLLVTPQNTWSMAWPIKHGNKCMLFHRPLPGGRMTKWSRNLSFPLGPWLGMISSSLNLYSSIHEREPCCPLTGGGCEDLMRSQLQSLAHNSLSGMIVPDLFCFGWGWAMTITERVLDNYI